MKDSNFDFLILSHNNFPECSTIAPEQALDWLPLPQDDG